MRFCLRFLFCLTLVLLVSFENSFGQKINYDFSTKKLSSLSDSINTFLIQKNLNLTIGIAMLDFTVNQINSEVLYTSYSNNKKEDSLSKHKLDKFPTMSVYKFHLALAILNQVDNGKFNLNDELIIKKSDLLEETHSPLRDYLKAEYGEKYETKIKIGFIIPLSNLLSYMVSQSDNNACDILFRLLGGKNYVTNQEESIEIRKKHTQKGVEKTNEFIQKLGLQHTIIAASEEKMHENFDNQYLNTTMPVDAVLLLKHFYQGKILQEKTTGFLWKIMVKTETGSNKIKAGLPQNETIVLGHKTGSSFRKEAEQGQDFGLKVGENDIGIVITPKNKYAIAIFIKNSTESNEVNNALIAQISKLIFDTIN